jgi:hypothetical protein
VKAEAAKCVLCIPNAGPRAQEFGPSSAQENARQKKVTYATQRELAKRCGLGSATTGKNGEWLPLIVLHS